MSIRRGLRKISELPAAGALGAAIMEVEIAGLPYQTGVGDMASVLQFTEERPSVPSPYDDEFDASTLDPKWTQTGGAASDFELQFSRLLGVSATQAVLQQNMALTHPLRIVCGIDGNNIGAAYTGVKLVLQGVTKGLHFGIDGGVDGNQRRLAALRLSNLGVYEVDLQTLAITTAVGVGGSHVAAEQLTMIVDATNVYCYYGPLGAAPKVWYTYARSNLGTLASFSVGAGNGYSVRWFRVDRATTQSAFPLDWAG